MSEPKNNRKRTGAIIWMIIFFLVIVFIFRGALGY